jgi:flagellar motor switch protein FliM
MRAVVDVDTAFVDQTTYREYIASLSNPSCSYQFTLGPTNGQTIIDFPMPLVFAFVDRIFGGKGSSQGVDARTMSQIEMGTIAKIVKRVIEDLEATWEPILRVEIYDIELETNPEFMQITSPSEIVILLAFEVNSTNASGLVSVCYPFFTLEPILPRLGLQTYIRHGRPDFEQTRAGNRLRLGAMDLPLVTELGRTHISVAEAESLRKGDVIRLSTRKSDPARVFVGGRPKFLAWPFAEDSGEVKLQVAGRVPDSVQDQYGRLDGQAPVAFAGKDTKQSWLPSD